MKAEDKIEDLQAHLHRLATLIGQAIEPVRRLNDVLRETVDFLGAVALEGEKPIIVEQLATDERSDVVYVFPCEGKVKEFKVTAAMIREYMKLYSQMDVDFEFRRMGTWLKANPAKKKTARGMPRFIDSWLSRAQNNGKFQQRVQLALVPPREIPPYEAAGYPSWEAWIDDIRTSSGLDEEDKSEKLKQEEEFAIFKIEDQRRKWESR